jgi:hypothetical protein
MKLLFVVLFFVVVIIIYKSNKSNYNSQFGATPLSINLNTITQKRNPGRRIVRTDGVLEYERGPSSNDGELSIPYKLEKNKTYKITFVIGDLSGNSAPITIKSLNSKKINDEFRAPSKGNKTFEMTATEKTDNYVINITTKSKTDVLRIKSISIQNISTPAPAPSKPPAPAPAPAQVILTGLLRAEEVKLEQANNEVISANIILENSETKEEKQKAEAKQKLKKDLEYASSAVRRTTELIEQLNNQNTDINTRIITAKNMPGFNQLSQSVKLDVTNASTGIAQITKVVEQVKVSANNTNAAITASIQQL